MAAELFLEVASVLALAAVVGMLAVLLRQPLLVGFLVAGVLAGPQVLGLVTQMEPFELLGDLGIVLLLFAVGLKLDPRLIRRMGLLAVVTGTAQVVITSTLGFLLALAFGLDALAAVYVGVAFSFSSTLIIVKLVSDKRDTETLHGRLAIGLLIVQDIWVVIVLVVLSLVEAGELMEGGPEAGFVVDILLVLGAGALLLGTAYFSMRALFPWLLQKLARSWELLLIFSLAWGVGVAAAAELGGLSAELGGFVAGLALAASEYGDAIGSRIVSLRDFMLLFFFVVLGAELDFAVLAGVVVPAVLFTLFVFFVKPLLVVVVFSVAGFRGRTNFMAASLMGQASEFGLILGAMGLALGHLGEEAMGLIALVTFLTMVASTYVILHNQRLYGAMSGVMQRFERKSAEPPLEQEEKAPVDVVVFGLGRFGESVAGSLVRKGVRVTARDIDPRAVARARRDGLDAVFGDAEDPEYLRLLNWRDAKIVVSTIPGVRTNRVLRKGLERSSFQGTLVVTAHHKEDAEILEEEGFQVVSPFRRAGPMTADQVVRMLENDGGSNA